MKTKSRVLKCRLLILVFIILLAAFLRLYKLGELPSGVNVDEVVIAYDAYSILKTGRDQWGAFLPLNYFESLGDYKLPVYHYLTILSIAIFGLDEFSARFPSAFFGVLTVLSTYFLTKEIFKKNPFAISCSLLAAFLLAINPWHIVLSRTGHEITVSVFLIVLGIFLFIKRNLLFFLIFFLGTYMYHTSRVFIPLILPILFFFYRKNIKAKGRRLKIYLLFYFCLFLLPFLIGFFSEAGRARVIQTMGIPKIGIINQLNAKRGQCLQYSLPSFFCRLFYNPLTFFGTIYSKNYLNHFSPFTLFTHGIQGPDTFSVSNRGLFYLFEAPLVLIGAFSFFKSKTPYKKLLGAWLLLYPVPGSLVDFNNSRRMSLVIPVLHILASLGILRSWQFINKFVFLPVLAVERSSTIQQAAKIKQKVKFKFLRVGLVMGFLVVVAYSFFSFVLDALEHNAVNSKDFKYGYKEMVNFVKNNEHKYKYIFVTTYYDYSFIYYLFFTKYDPLRFQDESNVDREMIQEDPVGEWVRVHRIDKIHFANAFNWEEVPADSLFVLEPNRKGDLIKKGTENTRRVLREIKNLDNEPVFTIIEVES